MNIFSKSRIRFSFYNDTLKSNIDYIENQFIQSYFLFEIFRFPVFLIIFAFIII